MTLSCGVQNDSAAADVTETAAQVTDAAAAPAAYMQRFRFSQCVERFSLCVDML